MAKKLAKILLADGSPNVLRQSEILDEIFSDAGDVPEGEQKKRTKTFRTKKEFEAVRQVIVGNEDLSVDREHRASLLQFLDWAMCLIEEEDMLFRVESYLEAGEEGSVEEVSEETVAPKRRIRMNE